MAFLGDFGKIFLGGSSTGEVARSTASALGVTNPNTLDVINKSAQGGADFISGSSAGGSSVDVSAPPAGVDSAASLSGLSQTSGFSSGLMGGDGFGTNQAFLGGFGLPGALTTIGKNLFKSPGSSALTGFGLGEVVDIFIDQFGQQKKLVITRKMQRDVKKLFMMSGGNFNMTAELYRMATGRSITGEQVVKIITKTFKNQGPYVTKAAVRKTRSTIRKMETLCDLKDRLCPPKRAAARRKPAARSTTITNVR